MATRKGLGQANILRTNNNTSTGYGVAYADEVSGHRTVGRLADLYALHDWQLSASGDNTDNDAIGQLWYVVNADGNSNGCYYQLKDWSKRNEAAGWSIADYTTKAELQDKIDNIATADEEDITTEGDTPQTQVLKLKDRAYDSLNASGKGYKILRKNWQQINGERKNVLTQQMINEPNTIYEIRYDFDLNGKELTIKEGCTLRFEGGSLHNGTLISNNTTIENCQNNVFNNVSFKNPWNIVYLSYNFFNNYMNDTELLRAIFDLGLLGENKCTIDLEEDRQYDIFAQKFEGYADSIYKYVGSKNKIIYGNNAVINDTRTKKQIGKRDYDGVFGFNNCHNISIFNLNYQNNDNDYNIETELGYIGASFILMNNDCSEFNIVSNIKGARYGVKTGDFSQYWTCGEYGIKNSTFNIVATKCGYPISIEVGDNLNITINSETHHRAAYLAGISNSKITINTKDIYVSPVHCLLTDSRYSSIKGEEHYKSCYNLDVTVHDKGSTIAPNDFSYLVAIQSYNLFTDRTTELIWDNINIHCVKEKPSNVVGLVFFEPQSGLQNVRDIFSNIKVNAVDIYRSTTMPLRFKGFPSNSYYNIVFEVVAPLSGVMWDNANKDPKCKVILNNSVLNSINIAGKVTVANSIITVFIKQKSSIGTDWYEADIINSDVNIDNQIDKINADFSSIKYVNNTTPIGSDRGLIIYDNKLKTAKVWNGNQWSFYDGLSITAKRSGTFAERPTTAQGISMGFAYFCTDKQSVEGATNGVMIYHKGNDSWVDALGRTIS